MQFLKLSHELITDINITSNEFRIYTFLMSLYNKAKKCSYPSIEVIAERTNISISTVKRSIKNLVKFGYMKVNKRAGISGNYNEYSEFKFLLFDSKKRENSSKAPVEETLEEKVETKKIKREPIIISDCKESGVQIEIEEICEYSIEHQQKIGLVLKQGIKLTEKQKFLIGDMDLETLRKAIHQFKKKKGKYFSLLLSLYIDQSEEAGVYVSKDIEKYLKGSYIRMTPEERETQQALRELELFGVPSVA